MILFLLCARESPSPVYFGPTFAACTYDWTHRASFSGDDFVPSPPPLLFGMQLRNGPPIRGQGARTLYLPVLHVAILSSSRL